MQFLQFITFFKIIPNIDSNMTLIIIESLANADLISNFNQVIPRFLLLIIFKVKNLTKYLQRFTKTRQKKDTYIIFKSSICILDMNYVHSPINGYIQSEMHVNMEVQFLTHLQNNVHNKLNIISLADRYLQQLTLNFIFYLVKQVDCYCYFLQLRKDILQ